MKDESDIRSRLNACYRHHKNLETELVSTELRINMLEWVLNVEGENESERIN